MPQLLMPLARGANTTAASFLPTVGSAAVRAALTTPFTVLCMYGPAASGKSHLLQSWATGLGGTYLAGQVPPISARMALDDVEKLDTNGQQALFHVLNNLSGQLVVASTKPVRELMLLADVKSRLLLHPQIELLPPTDAELKQLLLKWADDEQLELAPKVVDYVFSRADRSAAFWQHLMAQLNELSLQHKKAISIAMVREILQKNQHESGQACLEL